jgi:hypothetical protein
MHGKNDFVDSKCENSNFFAPPNRKSSLEIKNGTCSSSNSKYEN